MYRHSLRLRFWLFGQLSRLFVFTYKWAIRILLPKGHPCRTMYRHRLYKSDEIRRSIPPRQAADRWVEEHPEAEARLVAHTTTAVCVFVAIAACYALFALKTSII